jgi:hypothetical protein
MKTQEESSPVRLLEEKHYSASQAGERIGWVDMSLTNYDSVNAFISTATIGENGASLVRRIEPSKTGWPIAEVDETEGFENVSGLHLIVGDEHDGSRLKIAKEVNGQTVTLQGKFSPEQIIKGAWGSRSNKEPKTWVDSPSELIGLIKDGLAKYGKPYLFPEFYYYLNGHVAPQDIAKQTDAEEAAERRRLFFPDPEMRQYTDKIVMQADDLVNGLKQIEQWDKYILDLHDQEDIERTTLLTAFKASRIAISLYEERISPAAYSPFARYMYLPPGFNRRSTSQAEMRPLTKGHKGFQAQLEAFKAHNDEFVQTSVSYESEEATQRLVLAVRGQAIIRSLALAEEQA